MKSFFDDYSKVKKTILLILISGILLGSIIIGITAICDNNAKKRVENNFISRMVDEMNDMTSSDDYFGTDSDKFFENTGKSFKKFGNTIGNVYRIRKYRPWYFIGGFIIFASIGGATTLFIIYRVRENKKEQLIK